MATKADIMYVNLQNLSKISDDEKLLRFKNDFYFSNPVAWD